MPDSHLKIVIDLSPGQAGALLGQLQQDLKKTGAATDATAGANKRASLSWTELNSAISLGRQAIAAGEKVYDATIGKTIQYADEVRNLSRTIGSTAEESSRLIQAADDVFISTSSLTSALEAAIRKGVKPTIAGIGQLSDQYLKLAPGVERTKFLMDNFGRSGADLGALMEKGAAGIAKMGAAADAAGQTLSGEDLQAMLEYKEAVDGLQDSWQGLTIMFSRTAVPILKDVVKAETEAFTLQSRYNAAVRAGILSDNDIKQIRLADAVGIFGAHERGVAILEAAEAEAEHNRRIDEHAEKLNADTKATYNAADSSNYWTSEMWKAVDGTRAVVAEGDKYSATLAESAAKAEWLAAKTRDAIAANDEMIRAHRSWTEGVGGDLVAMLGDAGLKTDAYTAALRAVDEVYGTSFAKQEEFTKKEKALIDQFLRTGDLATFEIGLKSLADNGASAAAAALEDADAAAIAAHDSLDQMPEVLRPATTALGNAADEAGRLRDNLAGIERNIDIHVTYSESGAPIHKRASGGPVSAGVPYLVGEVGPEMFVPTSSGTIVPNDRLPAPARAGDTIIINDRLAVGLYFERRRQAALTYNDALM